MRLNGTLVATSGFIGSRDFTSRKDFVNTAVNALGGASRAPTLLIRCRCRARSSHPTQTSADAGHRCTESISLSDTRESKRRFELFAQQLSAVSDRPAQRPVPVANRLLDLRFDRGSINVNLMRCLG